MKNLSGRLIAYAACLEGSDPVRLFDRRVNAKRGLLIYSICLFVSGHCAVLSCFVFFVC